MIWRPRSQRDPEPWLVGASNPGAPHRDDVAPAEVRQQQTAEGDMLADNDDPQARDRAAFILSKVSERERPDVDRGDDDGQGGYELSVRNRVVDYS